MTVGRNHGLLVLVYGFCELWFSPEKSMKVNGSQSPEKSMVVTGSAFSSSSFGSFDKVSLLGEAP